MIELARPGFLWAGALLALGPLLLHLLRPMERTRRMLPTSRFLTPDPKRRVRLHRAPDERLLLFLRMLLCLLVGAAFAGMGWVGAERGVATVVIVDGGSAMRDGWAEAREALIQATGEEETHVWIARPVPDAVPELERLSPGVPSGADWTDLAPGDDAGIVRLGHLLRAVRTAAQRTVGYDSVSALVVTDPSWGAWSTGTATLRERVWPGRIGLAVPGGAPESEVVAPTSGDATRTRALDPSGADPDGPPAGSTEAAPPRRVALRAPAELRAPLARALAAVGMRVDTTGTDGSGDPLGITLVVGPGPEGRDGVWLADAQAAGQGERTAGAGGPSVAAPSDAFLLLDGRTVPGAGPGPVGTPAAGATVSLLRIGGRPAAAARSTDAGCRLVIPLDPDAPIVASPDLALVLEAALEAGCGVLPEPPGAEAAFRRLLEGEKEGGPAAVDIAEIRADGAGRPLDRWLLALALLVAVGETWTSRHIEKRRREGD